MLKKGSFLLFGLLAPLAISQTSLASDVAGSADMPGIGRYPNASITTYEEKEIANYPLVASPIKKVNNVVRADQQEWEDGQLTRIIYELPSGHGSDDAFRYYSKRLAEQGVKSLYRCEGRSCGPSNLMANKVFGVARLYGLDQDQNYFLGERVDAGERERIVLYTVRRGNRRVYALLDRLVVHGDEALDLAVVQRQLNAHGYLDLLLPSFDRQDVAASDSFQLVLQILQNDGGLKILIAGQSGAPAAGKISEQLSQSANLARQIRDLLVEKGVAKDRVDVTGLGPALAVESDRKQPSIRVIVLPQ